MNAVIPAAIWRAGRWPACSPRPWRRPLRRHGRNGRDRRREECTMGKIQVNDPIRPRERQFSELLVESSTEGIAAIDTEFRYTVWNPGIQAMMGTTRKQVLGRTVFEVFPQLEGTQRE